MNLELANKRSVARNPWILKKKLQKIDKSRFLLIEPEPMSDSEDEDGSDYDDRPWNEIVRGAVDD